MDCMKLIMNKDALTKEQIKYAESFLKKNFESKIKDLQKMSTAKNFDKYDHATAFDQIF